MIALNGHFLEIKQGLIGMSGMGAMEYRANDSPTITTEIGNFVHAFYK